MELKSFKAHTPIIDGTKTILACQTFDSPPPGEWEPCPAEEIHHLTPICTCKGSLILGIVD